MPLISYSGPQYQRCPTGRKAITIQKTGHISLSSVLSSETGTNWKYCSLMYDNDRKQLIIKLVNDRDDDENGLHRINNLVKGKRHDAHLRFSARLALIYFRIDFAKSLVYSAHYDPVKKAIIANMRGNQCQ